MEEMQRATAGKSVEFLCSLEVYHSPKLHVLTHPEALRNLSFGVFSEASLHRLSHVRLCDPMNCGPPGSSVHGNSPGRNTRVGCHALLQGVFLTRDGIQVSRIAGRFFPVCAIREAHYIRMLNQIISNWLIKSIGDGFKLQPLCLPWRLGEVGEGCPKVPNL